MGQRRVARPKEYIDTCVWVRSRSDNKPWEKEKNHLHVPIPTVLARYDPARDAGYKAGWLATFVCTSTDKYNITYRVTRLLDYKYEVNHII